MISAGELLHGADEDFLVNLYLATLGRWPDDAGLAHHRAIIAGQPERRLELIHSFLQSEEGRERGLSVAPDPGPVPVEQALAAQLRLRTHALRQAIEALRGAPALNGLGPAVAGEIAALGASLASLGVELRERMAAMEAVLAGRIPSAPNLSPAISLDLVNDLVEAAQAQVLLRLHQVERRLLEREGPDLERPTP
jgi:hypothetical protein